MNKHRDRCPRAGHTWWAWGLECAVLQERMFGGPILLRIGNVWRRGENFQSKYVSRVVICNLYGYEHGLLRRTKGKPDPSLLD